MKRLSKQYLFPIVMFMAVSIGGYILAKAGFLSVQKIRQLERVPATTISAILPGEVNITATAVTHLETLKSYYTKTPSIYYRYTEEVEETDSDGDTSWRTVDEKTESVDFKIEDASGSALVRRSYVGIEWSVPESFQTIKGDHRYTEWRIEPGDRLFIFANAEVEQQEIEIGFAAKGEYTPIISKYSESRERSGMGVTSVIKIWLGIALLSLSVYFFCYTFRIHRLVAYLGILTIVLSIILVDMGMVMMHDDLVSGEQRYRKQLSAATERVKGMLQQRNIQFNDWRDLHEMNSVRYLSLNNQEKQTIEQIRQNLLMARAQIVRHMQATPEKWFVPLWSLKLPENIYAPESSMQQLRKRISQYQQTRLQKTSPMIFSIIAIIIALVTAWFGLRQVKIKRYIENVPTSSASGVAFGVCEVTGQLVIESDSEALISPLTNSKCGWYYYHLQEKQGSGKDSEWVTIKKQTSSIDFYCEDRDGKIRIDADKADVSTQHKTVIRKGDRRHTEKTLCINDELFVIGYAGLTEKHPDSLTIQYSSRREPFIISNMSEQEVMLAKARKGIFSLNLSFSSVVLACLLLFGMAGGFAATDFLMSALVSPLFMLVIMLILHYNDIVFLKQRVERNWSNISVSLKKRVNLIPDISTVIKSYSEHEKSLLGDITEFRKKYSRSIKKAQTVKGVLEKQAGIKLQLELLQENYPELKTNHLYEKMMDILSSIENELMYMRAGYNDSVEVYNTRIKSVPDIIFTAALGFKEKDLIRL